MKHQLVHFISKHLDPIASEENEGHCAFTGQPVQTAVQLDTVIKPATANIADTFCYPSPLISTEAAACFIANRELRGNLFITENGIEKPMVNAKSAQKASRRTWVEVFKTYVDDPVPAVFLLSDESKRRLWVDACVTEKQPIRVFLNNSDMACQLTLDVLRLSEAMGIVRECLRLGFSKQSIKTCLFKHRDTLKKQGFLEVRQLEQTLIRLRKSPEFAIALFIGSVL